MILACHGIDKAFGENVILKDVSFGIEEHEKTALVGINGAGKSTLLKIITGEMSADNGEVIISRGKSLGYLAQQKMLDGDLTIYDQLKSARQDIIDAEERLRRLEQDMKHVSGEALDTLMDQYHRLQTWFDQENGYALDSEVTGVLKGLGFCEEDFSKHTGTLSGGQRTRVALGRLLLSSPDIILLDEPTNHLDILSIGWLENYLTTYKGAVLIVSHDRYFLNKVVTKVVELDQSKCTTFSGDYNAYAVKKEALREERLKAWMNQQAEIKHQEEVITKLKSFNREKSIKRAESREKMLDKIDRLEKPTEVNTQIKMTLEPQIESGNVVLTVEGLTKAFDQQMLFNGIDFEIRRGERIALIGDNGTGKTTILKIINGLLAADKGTITLGSRVVIGYYDQEHQVLHPEKTLFQEISDDYPELNNTQIRNALAAFLFTGDDVYKLIGELSGGERGRVSLAKLMLSKANFLILDEPTNHLDITSKEILESALNRYTGTILYVSHDRYFINQTATRILNLVNEQLVNYIGNYDYYMEKRDELTPIYAPKENMSGFAAGSAATLGFANVTAAGSAAGSGVDAGSAAGASSAANPASSAAASAPVDAKLDWQTQKEMQAIARKRKNDLKKAEEEIAKLEEEDTQIDAEMTKEEVFTNVAEVTKLSKRKAEIAERLEVLYELWECLAE